jgi:hypothetical protein
MSEYSAVGTEEVLAKKGAPAPDQRIDQIEMTLDELVGETVN